MLLEGKDIYDAVGTENGLSSDLVTSIGNAVFRSFADLQRNPPDVILDLQGIGRRFLRKKLLEEQIAKVNWQIAYLRGKDKDWDVNEELDELEILTRLYLRYEEFLDAKKEIKRKQYEFYASMGLAVPSLEIYKTSTDNTPEHQGLPTGAPTLPGGEPGHPAAPGAHYPAGVLPAEPGPGEVPGVPPAGQM